MRKIKDNPGERYAFRRIKSDAAAAGRTFNISFEWFINVCHQPCHYCGRVDQNRISVRSRSALSKDEFVIENFCYNGLDRVDNLIGYEESNCVPCCPVCNRGKNNLSYEDFMEYISILSKHQGGNS